MAGVDTVVRVVAGSIAMLVIIFVGWVGVVLIDPIYNSVIDTSLMSRLGWGAPQDTVYLFMTLAAAGLLLTVIVWWIASPIRDDVRQSTRPPGGPPF